MDLYRFMMPSPTPHRRRVCRVFGACVSAWCVCARARALRNNKKGSTPPVHRRRCPSKSGPRATREREVACVEPEKGTGTGEVLRRGKGGAATGGARDEGPAAGSREAAKQEPRIFPQREFPSRGKWMGPGSEEPVLPRNPRTTSPFRIGVDPSHLSPPFGRPQRYRPLRREGVEGPGP